MAPGERSVNDFLLVYDGFDPAEEGLREALTSTGNGYFCTRGCAEWEDADETHYPGTYAHGIYNRRTTVMGVHPVPNEDLVNLPNWLVLKLRIEGEEPCGLGNVELLSYRHEYDFRNALVMRELRFRDRAGRETRLRSRRFVSMHRMHQAALAWDLTPENWSGAVEVVSALDGRVVNQGVARYRQLEGRHLDPQGPRIHSTDVIALKARTRQSRIEVAEAARTRVYRGGEEVEVARSTYQSEDYIQQVLAFDVDEGTPVRVEKIVALYSSHDRGISEPLEAAAKSATRYPAFDRPSPANPGRGTSSGRSATRSSRGRSASSSCCASIPRISSRSARGSPPTTTPASRLAASTARHIAGTSSGTSSSSIPSSTSGCR